MPASFRSRKIILLIASYFFASLLFSATSDLDARVARRLAEKGDAARSAGRLVRAYLLYSKAVELDPDNPRYRQKQEGIAGAAELLRRTLLESADVSTDLAEARSEVLSEPTTRDTAASVQPSASAESLKPVMTAAQPAIRLTVAAIAPQPAAASAPPATPEAEAVPLGDPHEGAFAQPQVEQAPAKLSWSMTFRQDAAMSAREPRRLTENRTWAYLEMNSDLWTSANQKYRLQLTEQLRGYYDSVFGLTSFYPEAVRRNERDQVQMRRLLVNLSGPGWTLHVGRQQAVWGQALGMFVADVVNPKDYRQFLTEDFDDIRVPLWSLDAQKTFGNNGTVELFWSPDVRQSLLPVAGSEFVFYSPSASIPQEFNTLKPARNLANSTLGLRYSWLKNGWDSSIFYLRQIDDLPAESTALIPQAQPYLSVTEAFPQLNRWAASTSKPLGDFILRSEVLYTRGERFETKALGLALGRDSLTGMLGFSYPLRDQFMVDAQYFQTSLLGGGTGFYQPGLRSGVALRLADVASLRRLKPSVQVVMSPNQHDYWVTPKLTVRVVNSLFATFGVDWFGGALDTQFGQFRRASRFETSLFWKAKSY